jgi:hypothetical protein
MLSPPNPKSRLLSWTCAPDLTALTETESASVVITIATMTIGAAHGDNWRYYRNGACRDVELRERRGDEVVSGTGAVATDRERQQKMG